MMIKNYDESGEITHNSNWPDIPDYPYRTFTTGCSESGKTNVTKLNKTSAVRYWQSHSNQTISYLSTGEKK